MSSKKVLAALIIIAVLVWGYNLLKISQSTAADAGDMNSTATSKSARLGHISEFRKPSRDPFEPLLPYAKLQVQAQPQSRGGKMIAAPKASAPVQELPEVRINGIMWDPVKPMAVLQFPGGATQMVSTGQIIDGIMVLAIGKQDVTLLKDRKKWVIK